MWEELDTWAKKRIVIFNVIVTMYKHIAQKEIISLPQNDTNLLSGVMLI